MEMLSSNTLYREICVSIITKNLAEVIADEARIIWKRECGSSANVKIEHVVRRAMITRGIRRENFQLVMDCYIARSSGRVKQWLHQGARRANGELRKEAKKLRTRAVVVKESLVPKIQGELAL